MSINSDFIRRASRRRDTNFDIDIGWEDERSEGEGVRSNWGHTNDLCAVVHDRTPTRKVVSCTSSWGRDKQAVSLQNSEQHVVNEDLNLGHVFVAPHDGDLVERLELHRTLLLDSILVFVRDGGVLDCHHRLRIDILMQSQLQSHSEINAYFIERCRLHDSSFEHFLILLDVEVPEVVE